VRCIFKFDFTRFCCKYYSALHLSFYERFLTTNLSSLVFSGALLTIFHARFALLKIKPFSQGIRGEMLLLLLLFHVEQACFSIEKNGDALIAHKK
jgi:hypothetical protein